MKHQGIRKTDGPKKRGKKQARKVKRQRIKREISKYYPERDLPNDFKNGFGGKNYFLP